MKCKKAITTIISMILVVAFCIPAYADLATSSNAVLGLTPPEYLLSAVSNDAGTGIMPMSSLGTVTNTPVFLAGDVPIYFRWRNTSTGETGTYQCTDYTASSSGIRFKYRTSGNIVLTGFFIILKDTGHDYMPPYGSYSFSADLTSQFSFAYGTTSSYKPYFWSQKQTSNASNTNSRVDMDFASSSGDFYVAPQTFNYTSAWYVSFGIDWGYSQNLQNFDATIHLNFAPVSADASAPTLGGIDSSDSDFQSGISSSVDNISSGVSQMEESLTYISQSQNLIIQGIDNIILHISDQLYAFWDQLYNLIHVPTLAKMNEILNAIQNVDINITGDLTAAINEMSDAITDKLGSVTNQQITNDNKNTDEIVNGYDSSSIESDTDRLQSTLDEYNSVEDQLFGDAMENIEDFEFENPWDQFTNPLSDISYFLNAIFVSFGLLGTAVTFSLMLSVALILIGWYRFRGGG